MTMPSSLVTLMTAALLSFSLPAWTAGAAEQHSTHSGLGHAASSGEKSTAHSAHSMGIGSDMMAMCDKMMNAKSPQERKAMMEEHKASKSSAQ